MKKNNNGIVLALSLGIAMLASFFASKFPDGLDFVSEKFGFGHKAIEHTAPLAGYLIPHLGNGTISTAVAGTIGVLLCYMVFLLIVKLRRI